MKKAKAYSGIAFLIACKLFWLSFSGYYTAFYLHRGSWWMMVFLAGFVLEVHNIKYMPKDFKQCLRKLNENPTT